MYGMEIQFNLGVDLFRFWHPLYSHTVAAAARALIDTDMDALAIAKKSMEVASSICVYTNSNYVIECIPKEDEDGNKIQ